MAQMPIIDLDIQALVDNELGGEEERCLRAYIEAHPELQKRYKELRRQRHLLLDWYEQLK